ncbi:phosphatase PAP2 family protein [Paenibacillus xerothermodurans]|uniref:PAP2 family protein n=1 Tax=Paenibacillus xerothermodurans TaxID=1977292 RepID=A0A2W1P3J4_PAEXE|nr:phosphatase PAP2 family protein [Paenibacillus xerothermodurans]PZE21738.1 PAP2 family protein [Paenibacillus xerothermodurans]
MNMKWQFTAAFLVSLACAVGFGLVALLVDAERLAQFDAVVMSWIQGWRSPALTSVMKFFTFIGAGLPAVVISGFIMFILYTLLGFRRELIFFLWVTVGSALLNVALKSIFQRTRPDINRIIDASGYSFPSGHSMAAFSVYGVVTFLLWKHIHNKAARVALLCAAAAMILVIGISRVYLGVHYPSDVVGAYLASGFWLTFSVWFFQRYEHRRGR